MGETLGEKNNDEQSSQASTLGQNSSEQSGKDYLFFNVMPKIKASGELVSPSMQTAVQNASGPASPDEQSFLAKFLAKYKLYLIIGLVLLIVGPLIYIFVPKFFGNPYEEENLLADPNATGKPDQNSGSGLTTPKDWQLKYFNNEVCQSTSVCGDDADPDRDGLNNLQEFKLNTDPNNPDSDQDGLADGDEINVFESDPTNSHTAGDSKYSDSDFIKGGYDIKNPGRQFTIEQIKALGEKMTSVGLHQPTLKTLENVLVKVYKFGAPNPATDPKNNTNASSTLDQSLEAKQDRDAQRTNTIKNIGIALIKYFDDNKIFPKTTDFKETYDKVKPYIKVALNPVDPINKDPYVYTYLPNEKADDFTLSFYSETAGQVIKKRAADARKDKAAEEAAVYDERRKTDLETLRSALLLYSNKNAAGNQEYVFPTPDKYKTSLVPDYITSIPKDPKTAVDYEYKVSETFDSFTLKVTLDNPSSGKTGYLCNQEECRDY